MPRNTPEKIQTVSYERVKILLMSASKALFTLCEIGSGFVHEIFRCEHFALAVVGEFPIINISIVSLSKPFATFLNPSLLIIT